MTMASFLTVVKHYYGMDVKIEGDLNGLSDQQLDFIRKKLQENNIKGTEVIVSVLGEAGDNFTSALRVLTVKNEKEDLRIVAKITQNISRLLNDANVISVLVFTNEITMYNEVLPMMAELQKNAGIEPSDMFPVPICYGASNETPHEIMLLQDLMQENYFMMDKFKPLPSDTIKLILRTLAQYHSLCFVLKEKKPKEYADFCKKIVNTLTSDHFLKHSESFKQIGYQVSQIFEDNKLIANIIVETINEQMDRTILLEKADKGSKYTVIVHGDCWSNNFLFQLQCDKSTKCIMIDYQLVREASPVVDVLHLILNCTDYETRTKHYHEWIDYYHSQLEKYLDIHGLKAETTYPKVQLEYDVRRYATTNLGMAIFTCSLIIRSNEEIAQVKEKMMEAENADFAENFNMSGLQTKSVLQIKKRLEGIVNSCIDFGYLNAKNFM